MKVSFEGIGDQVVSFAAAAGTTAGVFVKVSANGTVAACAAEDNFIGYCINVDGGFAEVMTHGYISCSYTGDTAPTLGFCKLVADTAGKVTADSDGREFLVLELNTTAKTVGFIM